VKAELPVFDNLGNKENGLGQIAIGRRRTALHYFNTLPHFQFFIPISPAIAICSGFIVNTLGCFVLQEHLV
jgi:hypothetical protein